MSRDQILATLSDGAQEFFRLFPEHPIIPVTRGRVSITDPDGYELLIFIDGEIVGEAQSANLDTGEVECVVFEKKIVNGKEVWDLKEPENPDEVVVMETRRGRIEVFRFPKPVSLP